VHELSVAREIMSIVEAERRKHGFGTVALVRVRAGALSGIDPAALELAWEAARQGTFAAESRIELEVEEGVLVCRQCGARTPAEAMPSKCPACGSIELRLDGGAMGLDVVSLEVD
jgi:hydrogenase nickel incorporation protein HypA/HybF